MKMIGQLVESKAALYDAHCEEDLWIYSNNWASILWKTDNIDDRIYNRLHQDWPDRVYFKDTGLYELNYSLSSQLEYTGQRDNVIAQAFLNDFELPKSISYSYVRNSSTGLATNSLPGTIITVDQPNSYLDIRVKRNEYKGVIQMLPPECSFNLKRIRPL